jgi:hypothetical protein
MLRSLLLLAVVLLWQVLQRLLRHLLRPLQQRHHAAELLLAEPQLARGGGARVGSAVCVRACVCARVCVCVCVCVCVLGEGAAYTESGEGWGGFQVAGPLGRRLAQKKDARFTHNSHALGRVHISYIGTNAYAPT